MFTSPFDKDTALEHLDHSISPLKSLSSFILQITLPTIIATLHPNLIRTIVNDFPSGDISSSSSNTNRTPYSCDIKSSFQHPPNPSPNR